MRTSEIEKVEVTFYRRSQFNNYQTAYKNGGVRYMTETYGYTSTMDSLDNCYKVAKLLGDYMDIRIRMLVDGVALPECFLHEAQLVMHRGLKIK